MSSIVKKRIRVYAFAAAMVVAIMAGVPPLVSVPWPLAVLAVLGLVVGILNVRGKEQMDRFLISAIALIVATAAFLEFDGIPESIEPIFNNLLVFVTAALLYVSLAGIYNVAQERAKTYKIWFHVAAIILVVIIGIVIDSNESIVQIASVGLLLIGLAAGYSEGPKNPSQMLEGKGTPYLISAVAFQLSASSVAQISEFDFPIYESFLGFAKIILEKFSIFTTTALIVIAFMIIFWVLDDITDGPDDN